MLKRRVKLLESKTARPEVLVIISCYFGPSGWIEPVMGYHIGDSQLLRRDGETDEELDERACAAIRAQAPRDELVLRLTPVSEDEIRST